MLVLDFELDEWGCKGTVGLGFGSDGLDSEVDMFRFLYRSTSDRRWCYCIVWIYRYCWPIGDNSRHHTCGELMWQLSKDWYVKRTVVRIEGTCASRWVFSITTSFRQTGTGRFGMLPFRTKRLIMASALALSLVAPLTRISQYYW